MILFSVLLSGMYYDPFFAATDNSYKLQVCEQLGIGHMCEEKRSKITYCYFPDGSSYESFVENGSS